MGLMSVVNDDGFIVCGDQVLIFQYFQNVFYGFMRIVDNLINFLMGNFDLYIVWVSYSVWLFCQIQQSLCNVVCYVEECQVVYFF